MTDVNDQIASSLSPDFAAGVLANGGPLPRQGRKTDQAHQPIHPTKAALPNALNGDESRVYELIVRHFLACASRDALGKETTVNIDINGEAVSEG